MDIIAYTAAILIASGGILGAIVTINFRQNLKHNQKKVDTILNNISNNTDKLENAVIQLDKISGQTLTLVEKNQSLTKENISLVTDNHEFTKKIKSNTTQLSNAVNKLDTISEKTLILVKDNQNLTKKTVELSENTKNILTGGDSYPFIEILWHTPYSNDDISDDGDTWRMLLRHEGNYQIRDFRIKIIDLIEETKFNNNSKGFDLTNEQVNMFTYEPNFSILNPGENLFIEESINKKLLNRSRKNLNILVNFQTGNGVFNQKIKIINLWGTYSLATRLMKGNNIIFQRTEGSEFPSSESGNLDFSVLKK